MGLIPLIIDGVAHSLAVNGKTFIFLGIGFVPLLQSPVQMGGIDPNQNIADDEFAGDNVATVGITATETLPGVFAEAVGPIGDCSVSAHPAQAGCGGNSQDRGESMPLPLSATMIGYFSEKRRERLHLLSIEHHFGTSYTIR